MARPERMTRIGILLAVLALLSACAGKQPLPDGLSYRGGEYGLSRAEFVSDMTYTDPSGERAFDQQIFDRAFKMIASAQRFVLVDMFLYNDFQGPRPEPHRQLARQMTEVLVARKKRSPGMRIVVITDPVNTMYGGVAPPYFQTLRDAGIELYITDLTKLPDSNPSWSGFWRTFIEPLGNSTNGWIPTPFGDDPVTLRSYLSFLNFKANHRKIVITDKGSGLTALVTSGNPHDPSSAHSNIGAVIDGPAAWELLQSENAALALNDAPPFKVKRPREPRNPNLSVQVITEGKIQDAVLTELRSLKAGDKLDIAMFFISDRRMIAELKKAHDRGVAMRIVLDPNLTAFGFNRNGIPNVPVAAELRAHGLNLRWCKPTGEQCHYKIMMARHGDGSRWMTLGSTNLTRRNLDDFNLETNLLFRGNGKAKLFGETDRWFEAVWTNKGGRQYTKTLAENVPNTFDKILIYRFMEGSGWAPF